LAALRPEQPTNESFVMKPTSKTEVLPVQHVRLRTLLHMTMALFVALLLLASPAFAHAVAEGDKGYIQEISGVNLIPFIYLGAKHMVTGYDHILFLFGVIFFLYKLKHIAIYVSLFALGHSLTLLFGVYFNIGINSYLIDAIIGLSADRQEPDADAPPPGIQSRAR
jgi:HupE / UreJ protein